VLAVLNEHLTGKTDEYRIEYRVREKDGGWTWFLDRGQVVERDENNMPVRMTGTHQNISLQKKQDQAVAVVQQQLHAAVDHERNFLQTVIDSAGDPVMVIDLDFNLLLTLDALLDEGSVAGAARRLRLSPSAMSRALARLRETPGYPLLGRAGRCLVPPPRARALRPHAQNSSPPGSTWFKTPYLPAMPERRGFAPVANAAYTFAVLGG